jgi:hypothetical protein
LARLQYSLRALLLSVLLCGTLLTAFAYLRPWYYGYKWNSLGAKAVEDAELLEALLEMGPSGWKIATADTIADDPDVRAHSGVYCLNGRFDYLEHNCVVFWKIWANRCLRDEGYLHEFCTKNPNVIPVIIVVHSETRMLEGIDGVSMLPVYSKYRDYFLEFLDSEGVSPPCPRDIVDNARRIVANVKKSTEAGQCPTPLPDLKSSPQPEVSHPPTAPDGKAAGR